MTSRTWRTAARTSRRRAPISTDDLYTLAAALGVTITEHTGGPKGRYVHQARRISLRRGLLDRELRCTLAHELAHAVAGDEPTGIAWLDARMERIADERAARWLILPADYAAAEALYGPHPGALARELGVTHHILRVWQTLHERTPA